MKCDYCDNDCIYYTKIVITSFTEDFKPVCMEANKCRNCVKWYIDNDFQEKLEKDGYA